MDTENLDENDQSKAVMLFGRDIRKIPCFKQSMLFGIYSGLGIGLATFMFTSRVTLSTNLALGSFMGVGAAYMCFCRYNYVMQKYAMQDIQYMLEKQTVGKEKVDEAFQEQKTEIVSSQKTLS